MRRVSVWVARVTIGAFLLAPTVWAQVPSDRWGRHMMGWDGGWYGMILGPLFMIVGLAVAIALALALVRWFGGPQGAEASPPPESALEILKKRFARGDIDKAEYEDRRRAINE